VKHDDLALIPFEFVDHDIVKHINAVSQRYDFVVIDAGGFDSEIQRQLCKWLTSFLCHSALSVVTLNRFVTSIRFWTMCVTPTMRFGFWVLLTNVHLFQTWLSASSTQKAFSIEPVPLNLYTRNVYDDAEESGRTIFEMTGAERDQKAEAEII